MNRDIRVNPTSSPATVIWYQEELSKRPLNVGIIDQRIGRQYGPVLANGETPQSILKAQMMFNYQNSMQDRQYQTSTAIRNRQWNNNHFIV